MNTRGLARAHGTFNLVGGLWPLVHMRSFEAVLGPKVDRWLVRTVALLLISNGLVQLTAPDSDDGIELARRLGIGTAGALATIDLIYVPRHRISKMYLVDATSQLSWIAAWLRRPTPHHRRV